MRPSASRDSFHRLTLPSPLRSIAINTAWSAVSFFTTGLGLLLPDLIVRAHTKAIMSSVPRPPTLNQKYSGIPERLLEKATKVKQQTYAALTTDVAQQRAAGIELPVIPKGYPRTRFNKAIESIQSQIGAANVELNTGALVDGWLVSLILLGPSECAITLICPGT